MRGRIRVRVPHAPKLEVLDNPIDNENVCCGGRAGDCAPFMSGDVSHNPRIVPRGGGVTVENRPLRVLSAGQTRWLSWMNGKRSGDENHESEGASEGKYCHEPPTTIRT